MDLEEMEKFFNKRADSYEEHMFTNVDGANEYYVQTAKLIPNINNMNILDLGCGTGLEIDEIFKINPTAYITGIDLSSNMLEKILKKHYHKQKQLNLIIGDYFIHEFPKDYFNAAISVQTLHHFEHEVKIMLYKKIYESLKENGVYIETDYMAPSQEFEDFCFAENKRIRCEMGITCGYYHYDTPCTVENQISMLEIARFKDIQKIAQYTNTAIIISKK